MTAISAECTDSEWVGRIAGDDLQVRDEALADLRALLVEGLARAFRQFPRDSALIQDSVQDALLRIVQNVGSFRGDSRFTSWALAIATRVTLSEMRRARWRDVSLDEMSEAGRLDQPVSVDAPASLTFERGRLMEVVTAAINEDLTDKQRAAIQAELGGAPPDEIARRLGTSRNALYKLVYDGRARLKKAILSSGWTEDHIRSVLNGMSQ